MAHELPPLPYAYEALEPHIDAQTMKLHHDLHHKSYVDGLNKAEQMLAQARAGRRSLAGEALGARGGVPRQRPPAAHHLLAEPRAGGQGRRRRAAAAIWQAPDRRRLRQLRRVSATTSRPRPRRSRAAAGRSWPSGRTTRKLVILTAEKHQNLTQWGVVPLAGARRLGTRLLPDLPEPARRVREARLRDLQLGRRRPSVSLLRTSAVFATGG